MPTILVLFFDFFLLKSTEVITRLIMIFMDFGNAIDSHYGDRVDYYLTKTRSVGQNEKNPVLRSIHAWVIIHTRV